MEFDIKKVLERDVDLLIINKLLNDSSFINLFLEKINLKNYKVAKCIHSFSDENGENDITVIIEKENHRFGLLIENKISAIAMPNQYERYIVRGRKLINDGVIEKTFIFIIAPNDYLISNSEAKKYDYKISYEEMLEFSNNDIYFKTLIEEAIREKKKGYSVIEDKNVTEFWHKLYKLIDSHFQKLNIVKHYEPRGSNAQWPIFITPVKEIKIIYKSDREFCDLTFPNAAECFYEVYDIVKEHLEDYMFLKKTNKSLAIRINVPKVQFQKSFESQIEDLLKSLEAVVELQDLLEKIDYESILSISN